MEHRMRRFRQQLSCDEALEILNRGSNGTLSLVDTDGEPYGVPVSYVYDGSGHIYIHSAASGHKIDCVMAEPRCSFSVVAQDDIVAAEFTTYFRSVIVSGRIRIVSAPDEVRAALVMLADKYCHGIDPTEEIDRFIQAVRVLSIDIGRVTGKESIELVRRGEAGGVVS